MPPPSREVWASAFALQSRSDWQVFDRLAADPRSSACHELHYLQMACEKIAKAYRCRDTAANLEELLTKHVGFTKFMGSFLASPSIKDAYRGRDAQRREVAKLARVLAREIERLGRRVASTASYQSRRRISSTVSRSGRRPKSQAEQRRARKSTRSARVGSSSGTSVSGY